jgi:hypothetical protein
MRTVALPPWLVSRLMERQVNAVPNKWDVMFCSAMEKLRDTSNTTKHVRELLDEAGSTWAVGHTFGLWGTPSARPCDLDRRGSGHDAARGCQSARTQAGRHDDGPLHVPEDGQCPRFP